MHHERCTHTRIWKGFWSKEFLNVDNESPRPRSAILSCLHARGISSFECAWNSWVGKPSAYDVFVPMSSHDSPSYLVWIVNYLLASTWTTDQLMKLLFLNLESTTLEPCDQRMEVKIYLESCLITLSIFIFISYYFII